MRHTDDNSCGFSLVEVIIALVASGILAVMIASFLAPSIANNDPAFNTLRNALEVFSVMEQIQTDYENNPALDLDGLRIKINNAESDSSIYGSFRILYNDFVTCDPAVTTVFTGPSGDSMLLVSIAELQHDGVKTSSLFVKL